ncbi:MAG: hypothetical protein AB1324_04735 [Candidatus Micrarchaeota archaeon]
MRGLPWGEGLVEVAKDGLMASGLEEGLQVRYAKRIKDAERAAFLLNFGVDSETAQEVLASVVAQKGDADQSFRALLRGNVSSEKAQEALASKIADESDHKAGTYAYALLVCRMVRSHKAEETLAGVIAAQELAGRAQDLLERADITERSQMVLAGAIPRDCRAVASIITSGNVTREVAGRLAEKMPKACSPVDSG